MSSIGFLGGILEAHMGVSEWAGAPGSPRDIQGV